MHNINQTRMRKSNSRLKSFKFMRPQLLDFSIWTGQYSKYSHYQRSNSMCGRVLNLEYYAAKVSFPPDNKKSKSKRLIDLKHVGHEFDLLSRVWFWPKNHFKPDFRHKDWHKIFCRFVRQKTHLSHQK